MDMILVAGLWLERTVWDTTITRLTELGHTVSAVWLPGADDDSAATLQDQLDAVLAPVDQADRPLVVGHSAACTLAWLAADRRRDIAGVVLIGGMPTAPGDPYGPPFPVAHGGVPFPGREPFAGPDSDDLDALARERLAAQARPVPIGVAQAIVDYSDVRRYDVPVTMICPEYSPNQAREWLAAGHIPELEKTPRLTFVDIDSGHWPMVRKPTELAEILDRVARSLHIG